MVEFSVIHLGVWLCLLSAGVYFYVFKLAHRRAAMVSNGALTARFHSQPAHHAAIHAINSFGIGLVVLLVLQIAPVQLGVEAFLVPSFVFWMSFVLVTGLALLYGGPIARRSVRAGTKARDRVEGYIKSLLIFCSVLAVLTTLGIIMSLLIESLRFFEQVPFLDFLLGLQWSPQTALREDQAGQSGSFGAVPIIAGTFLIMAVAIFVAAPIGLMIAIYLSEYATKRTRSIIKPAIEILAGVPTVVYGFFALLTVGPLIRNFAESLGFSVPTQSAIAAGSVMGVMIIPFISSLSDDVINAVPQNLRDGSFALGATKSETMSKVVFAGALPGIIGALLLAVSRAIGETMIVVMAAGRAGNLTGNPFEATTTVTVQIVSLLTGDQEFDSPKTLAAFALGLVLFSITLALNVISVFVIRRYRERYE